MDPALMNGSVLAFIGDGVLEVMVRDYLVIEKHYTHAKDLQFKSIDFVSANAHSKFIDYALNQGLFSEEELIYYKRGKNFKEHRTLSKNVSRYAHSLSTGFEAVIGYLHLTNQKERLEELFNQFTQFVERNQEVK